MLASVLVRFEFFFWTEISSLVLSGRGVVRAGVVDMDHHIY